MLLFFIMHVFYFCNIEKSASKFYCSYHSRTKIEEGITNIMELVECLKLKGPDINEEQYWESNDGKNPELNAIPAFQK